MKKTMAFLLALILACAIGPEAALAELRPFERLLAAAGLDAAALERAEGLTSVKMAALLAAITGDAAESAQAGTAMVTYEAAATAFLSVLGYSASGGQGSVDTARALGLLPGAADAADAIPPAEALYAAYRTLFADAPSLADTAFRTFLERRNGVVRMTGVAELTESGMTILADGRTFSAEGLSAEYDALSIMLWYAADADGGIGSIVYVGSVDALARALVAADGLTLAPAPPPPQTEVVVNPYRSCACGDNTGTERHSTLYSEYDIDPTHTICGEEQLHTCAFCGEVYTCTKSNRHAQCIKCGGHWCVGTHETAACGVHRLCEEGRHSVLATCKLHRLCQPGKHSKIHPCTRHYQCEGTEEEHSVGKCEEHYLCQYEGYEAKKAHSTKAACGIHYICQRGTHDQLAPCGVHYICEECEHLKRSTG